MEESGLNFAPRGGASTPAPRPARLAAARLALIHAHRIVADLLQHFCRAYWGFEVVAVEFNGTDGRAAVERDRPELVLVSLTVPDLSAGELIVRLRAAAPAAKFVGLTDQCNEYLVHSATQAGCHGLIYMPEEDLHGLGQIIERVRRDNLAASERIQLVQRTLRTNPTAYPKLLTKTEQKVLVCVAHAMSDEEIGRQLGFTKANARSHLDHIMRKLGIHKATKLIGWCAEKGFNLAPLPARESKERI
jgi:DNA-binding NarL/FixJ family response regulator